MEKKYAIGIDLGTTYSCISVYQNNNVDVIPNELDERTTPSVVSFTQYEILAGRKAKNQITQNISNIIYDAKRLIGRRYEDKEVQDDMKKCLSSPLYITFILGRSLFPFITLNDHFFISS